MKIIKINFLEILKYNVKTNSFLIYFGVFILKVASNLFITAFGKKQRSEGTTKNRIVLFMLYSLRRREVPRNFFTGQNPQALKKLITKLKYLGLGGFRSGHKSSLVAGAAARRKLNSKLKNEALFFLNTLYFKLLNLC